MPPAYKSLLRYGGVTDFNLQFLDTHFMKGLFSQNAQH